MIIKFFSALSALSTGVTIYSIGRGFTDNNTILYPLGVFGVMVGIFIAFYVVPRLVDIRDVKSLLSVSFIMSLTYMLNSGTLRDVVIEQEVYKLNPRMEKDLETIQNAETKSIEKLETTLSTLSTHLLTLEAKRKEQLSSVDRASIAKTIMAKKKYPLTYRKWWREKALSLGCDIGKIKTTSDLVECFVEGEVDNSIKVEIEKTKGEIEVIKKEIMMAKSKNLEIQKRLKEAQNRVKNARLEAERKAPSKYLLASLLFVLGLFIEGFIVGFDLFLLVRKETIAKEKAKETMNTIEKISQIAYNVEVLRYLIAFANREKKPLGIYKYGLWQSGSRAGRVKAKTNSIVAALLYALNEGLQDYTTLTTSHLHKVNKDGLDTILNVEAQRLGSTSWRHYKDAIDYLAMMSAKNPQYKPFNLDIEGVDELMRGFIK
jgi:hypothetical protein